MRRHHICLGDTTTAGGVVVCATSGMGIGGRAAAVEGDAVECKACRSTGRIRCVGPRHPGTVNGRRLALEGDLCACTCPRPPVLVAGQGASYETLDVPDGAVAQASEAAAAWSTEPGSASAAAMREGAWVGLQVSEAASCEGLACRVHLDDGSLAHALCTSGNQIRVDGLKARYVLRVDYLLDEPGHAPSLSELLLQRMLR